MENNIEEWVREAIHTENPVIKSLIKAINDSKNKKFIQIILKFSVRFYQKLGFKLFQDISEFMMTEESFQLNLMNRLNKDYLEMKGSDSPLKNPLLNV